MRIKPIYTYHAIVFSSGFLICLAGVTLEDIGDGFSLAITLGHWSHYLAPSIMGIGMSLIGQIFWVRKEHRLKVKKELVKNENKYRTLFENMLDAVCILDNEKYILDVNQASADLFEYAIDELIGMTINAFIYEEDKAISKEYFEDLDNSGSYSMYEGRIITKTGKIRWIQVNSTEFLEDGIKIGSQDIIRDITKRKNIEIELNETVGKLNELNSTKDKLFSIIAHDLRSPFSAMLGLSELLLDQMDDSANKKHIKALKTINSTAQSTLYLLENLLNWAKSQAGQISFHPDKLSLRSIFDDVIDLMTPSVLVKRITLKHDLADDMQVFADENMLRSVVSNLVSNAIKFTAKDGNILLSAHIEQDLVEIWIADDGIGIEKEKQENLFNIKTNISTPGTSNEKGSGLGLVLCMEFVQLHGGRIWVESDGEKGSLFKFTLPTMSC